MKIVVYTGGASADAMRMFGAVCKMLESYASIKARPFGGEGEDSGVEVLENGGDRSEEWIAGYVHGCADHWNGEFSREERA